MLIVQCSLLCQFWPMEPDIPRRSWATSPGTPWSSLPGSVIAFVWVACYARGISLFPKCYWHSAVLQYWGDNLVCFFVCFADHFKSAWMWTIKIGFIGCWQPHSWGPGTLVQANALWIMSFELKLKQVQLKFWLVLWPNSLIYDSFPFCPDLKTFIEGH